MLQVKKNVIEVVRKRIDLDNNFSDFKIGAVVYTYIATECLSQVNGPATREFEIQKQ